jgi:hypothetical protein
VPTRLHLTERNFRERELAIKEAELELKRWEQSSADWRNPFVVAYWLPLLLLLEMRWLLSSTVTTGALRTWLWPRFDS